MFIFYVVIKMACSYLRDTKNQEKHFDMEWVDEVENWENSIIFIHEVESTFLIDCLDNILKMKIEWYSMGFREKESIHQ